MAAMDAIEVPERQDGPAPSGPAGRRQEVDDIHKHRSPQARLSAQVHPARSAGLVVTVDLQYEPIIGQLHAIGGAQVAAWQLVADVRELRTFGPEPRDDIEGLGHAEVRRMGTIAQRVDDDDAHPFE